MPNPLISLTTDYGTGDHLVGTLKGVILKIHPDVQIVDITHSVIAYDVLDGALAIGAAAKFFPPRTIHVVVVDPGVGTPRRPILVSADNQYFIGPDNGVFSLIYERDPNSVVRHITSEHYFLRPISPTFHGRDIFAPVAAWLAKNSQPEAFGEPVSDFARFALPKPKSAGGALKGVILRADNFGNLLTNFTADDLPEAARKPGAAEFTVAGKPVKGLVETFANGVANEAVALVGSSGFIEIAVNKGSAARVLGANRGAEVVLKLS
ncbi:MAG TPA: SAM-dependent chlorinase/fluorinase [Candidatus Acidoferrales bacterium]|nr:SAM-dependent chlorinase/fluorinase [Candidatus Acidoferrales bacterium]